MVAPNCETAFDALCKARSLFLLPMDSDPKVAVARSIVSVRKALTFADGKLTTAGQQQDFDHLRSVLPSANTEPEPDWEKIAEGVADSSTRLRDYVSAIDRLANSLA